MSGQHTPGRLVVGELTGAVLVDERGDHIASTYNGAIVGNMQGDARRLAACWNALTGIATERIEEYVVEQRHIVEHAISQWSELKQLRADLGELFKSNKAAKAAMVAAEAERDAVKADCDHLRDEVKSARLDIDVITAERDQLRAELDAAHAVLREVLADDCFDVALSLGSDWERRARKLLGDAP